MGFDADRPWSISARKKHKKGCRKAVLLPVKLVRIQMHLAIDVQSQLDDRPYVICFLLFYHERLALQCSVLRFNSAHSFRV
jgi:hypothetical protein